MIMAKKDSDHLEDNQYTPKQPKKLSASISDLPKDWKDIYFKLATEGASDASLYTAAGLTRRRHESLTRTDEDYKEWFIYCHEVSTAYWEDFGRVMCRRKDYNSATYNMIMMNRCGWTNNGQKKADDEEKPEAPAEKPVSLDEFKTQSQANNAIKQ